MLKKVTYILICILTFQSYIFCEENKKIPQEFIIATGAKGSPWHVVLDSVAKFLTQKLEPKYGYRFKTITSLGSFDNIELVQSGKAHFGTATGIYVMMAGEGRGFYKGNKKSNIRSSMYIWRDALHYMIRKDLAKTSNIMDLKLHTNKAYSLGPKGVDYRMTGEILLSSLGIKLNNIAEVLYHENTNSFLKKNISGFNIPSFSPSGFIKQLWVEQPNEVAQLQFSEKQLSIINQKYPVWSHHIIKQGTYPNQTKDIYSISQPTMLITSKKVPKEVVYIFLKTIYDNLETLHEMHPELKKIIFKNIIQEPPVNFHKGARKYYKENKVKIRMPDAYLHKMFG